MTADQVALELEAISSPIINKQIAIMGAARNAFNRHSRASMEEFKKLQEEVEHEIKVALKQLQALATGKPAAEKADLPRIHSILTHLHLIAESIGGLRDPIHKKIKDGVLFSDKAVSQTNYLFDHQGGMLRSLLDIIKTDNEFLKKYLQEEGRNLIQSCITFATEHEARMIEGVCLPQAAPLFLAILERVRTMTQHEMDIAQLLAKKS